MAQLIASSISDMSDEHLLTADVLSAYTTLVLSNKDKMSNTEYVRCLEIIANAYLSL